MPLDWFPNFWGLVNYYLTLTFFKWIPNRGVGGKPNPNLFQMDPQWNDSSYFMEPSITLITATPSVSKATLFSLGFLILGGGGGSSIAMVTLLARKTLQDLQHIHTVNPQVRTCGRKSTIDELRT